MTKKRFVLIILSLCIGILACDKEPKKYSFQTDTAAYFFYTKNSQWIYENINGGLVDTIVCTESAKGFPDRPEGITEVSSATLEGKIDKKIVIRSEAIPTQNVDRIAMVTLVNNIFQPGPIVLNINGTLNPEDSTQVNKLLTFESNSVKYDNVWEITLKSHPVYKKLWFSRDIGIIKKIYINRDTFNLIQFTPGQ